MFNYALKNYQIYQNYHALWYGFGEALDRTAILCLKSQIYCSRFTALISVNLILNYPNGIINLVQ